MPSRTMIVGMVLNWLRHIPAALCDSLGEPHREESSYEPALPTRSIFLGNYALISFEAEAFDLPLHGELPKELAGTLYRNGPNPRFAPRGPNHHWVIGDGMIHPSMSRMAECPIAIAGCARRNGSWSTMHIGPCSAAGAIRQQPIHQCKARTVVSPILTSFGTAVSYLRWKKVIDRFRSIQRH